MIEFADYEERLRDDPPTDASGFLQLALDTWRFRKIDVKTGKPTYNFFTDHLRRVQAAAGDSDISREAANALFADPEIYFGEDYESFILDRDPMRVGEYVLKVIDNLAAPTPPIPDEAWWDDELVAD